MDPVSIAISLAGTAVSAGVRALISAMFKASNAGKYASESLRKVIPVT